MWSIRRSFEGIRFLRYAAVKIWLNYSMQVAYSALECLDELIGPLQQESITALMVYARSKSRLGIAELTGPSLTELRKDRLAV